MPFPYQSSRCLLSAAAPFPTSPFPGEAASNPDLLCCRVKKPETYLVPKDGKTNAAAAGEGAGGSQGGSPSGDC